MNWRFIGWAVDSLLRIVVIVILGWAIIIFLQEIELIDLPWNPTPTPNPDGELELVGVVLATVGAGIMLQVLGLRRAEAEWQKKNNTLRVLIRVRQGAEVERHRKNVLMHYPAGTSVPPEHVDSLYMARSEWVRADIIEYEKISEPVIDSIFYIANFYEFICTAVEQRVLDEMLIIETIGPIMYKYYYKTRNVIDEAQRRAREENPKNRIYASYQTMINQWEAKKLSFVPLGN